MKVLVVGGGGREHALVWKISQSPLVKEILCAPGNGGISRIAKCVPIKASDIEALARLAGEERVDLTVVGPEEPLVLGIEEEFRRRGLRLFGVSREAATLEGSKSFAKELMEKHGIPTASFRVFENPEEAKAFIKEKDSPCVVKADGLAAGKGVFVCREPEKAMDAVDEIMVRRAFGDAGRKVVIEELLEGEEASFLAITDGEAVIGFPPAQDHKPVFDEDRGPNTGGMGAYSPAPVVTGELEERIMETIMVPAVRAMAKEGRPYRGILYAGLMISNGEPKVLEFNVRLGDPEAQPLLVRLKSDIVPLLLAATEGNLEKMEPSWDDGASVCVVMASRGYPGKYERGKVILGLEEAEKMEGVFVFHAGTRFEEGKWLTDGGRVLGVTARGEDIPKAIERAYEAVGKIHWEGVHYRKDIGKKALRRLRRDG
jgi:phosphoribosylamine--glycine ligase